MSISISKNPDYYRSLEWILDNDPVDLDLNFSVNEETFGQVSLMIQFILRRISSLSISLLGLIAFYYQFTWISLYFIISDKRNRTQTEWKEYSSDRSQQEGIHRVSLPPLLFPDFSFIQIIYCWRFMAFICCFSLVVKWRFISRIEPQMKSFMEGYTEIIKVHEISLFDENELEVSTLNPLPAILHFLSNYGNNNNWS